MKVTIYFLPVFGSLYTRRGPSSCNIKLDVARALQSAIGRLFMHTGPRTCIDEDYTNWHLAAFTVVCTKNWKMLFFIAEHYFLITVSDASFMLGNTSRFHCILNG